MKIVKNFFDKAPEAAILKHVEPENCENLGAKDVNPEVFRCMKEPHKTLDFSVKTVQHNVASSSVASLRVIDTLTDMSRNGYVDREAAKYLLELVCDAAKLNSRAYQELSQVRKVLLKDLLSPRYRSLCFNKTFGNQLFGEDVSKSVKAIDDESRILKDFKKSDAPKTRIPQPSYQPKNWGGRGRGQFRPQQYQNFRGRGRGRGRGAGHATRNETKQYQK